MLAPYMRHRMGLGAPSVGLGAGLSDFESLVGSGGSPAFKNAWGDVEAQITLEGSDVASSVLPEGIPGVNQIVDMTGAKIAMADAFTQISSSSFGVTVQQAADAAKQYVLMGQTVLGAVNTVVGMASLPSAERDKAVAAFTGTMMGALTTAAIAAGAVSAGLGAAIVFGVGAILSVMESAGLVGGSSSAPQFTVPPDFTVGYLGAWGPKIAPNSLNWRHFPDPTLASDASWFSNGDGGSNIPIGPGYWRDAFFGVGQPGADQRWSHNGRPNPPGFDQRPIDNAFGRYSEFVESVIPGTPDFRTAFIAAWKSNAEYALNGLAVQSDWAVLVHTLRMWNRSHKGPSVGMTATWWLIGDALNQLSKTDPLISPDQTTLMINVGPLKTPPVAAGVAAVSSSKSSASSVAKTAATAGGALALGTVAYSYATGTAINLVVKHGWAATKRFWNMVVGEVEHFGRRRNPIFRSTRRRRRR